MTDTAQEALSNVDDIANDILADNKERIKDIEVAKATVDNDVDE